MVTQIKCSINNFTNIFHIGDIHIRLTKRHDEYMEVFNNLYKSIDKTPPTTVICVLGDLFHNKSDLSPECVEIASEFLKNLADRRPTILIAGNHDATLANKNRMDSLSPIVNAIRHENLFYLKDTGVYIFGDILFNNYSVFDEHTPEKYIKFTDIPKMYVRNVNHFIALYHGGVNNAITDIGFKITNRSVTNELFDGHHIVLLGDIHKHQVLQQYDDVADKPVMVYCGSIIQQNHGESLKGHGFVYWDLKSKAFKHFEITNSYGFYTVEINKGKLLTDITDIPKKARLRLNCFESVATEVKSVLSNLRSSSEIVEVSYVRIDNTSTKTNIVDVTDLNLQNISNIEYQNKILSEYITEKHPDVSKQDLIEIENINRQLNDLLEKNVVVKNIRWKPKTFEFDNMFSYGEGNIIDFTKMHNVVGLFASNASGKSSVLSALSFCIFDKCDRAFKASTVLNVEKMNFRCKFNFEINKVDYFIERKGSSDKKGNVKVDVKFWKNENGKITELNGEARRSTNDIIRDYVGTYDDFILTVLSVQNNKSGSFIDMGQTERKDLLAQFIGLTIFDTLYGMASEKFKESSILLKNFNKTDYGTEISNLNDDISRTQSLISENTQSVERIILDRDIENNKLIEETKKLINVSSAVTDLVSLEKTEIYHKDVISSAEVSCSLSKTDISKMEDQLKTISVQISIYDEMDISTKYETLDGYKKDLSNMERLLESKKIMVNNKLQKLKTLEEHKYDPNCDYCINNVFVKDAIETKKELESDKLEIREILNKYSLLKTEISKLSSVDDNYKNYQNLIKSKNTLSAKISNENNSVLRLENKLESEKNLLDKVRIQIKDFYDQKDAIESNKSIYRTIDDIKIVIKNLEYQIKQTNNSLVDLKTKINSWISRKELIEKTIKEIKKLESEYKSYQIYSDAVSRDGIQYKIISKAMPEIEKEVNSILHQIVEFTVSFQTDGKNVSTFIVYDDKKWPLESSSGMEKFISSLAIRVALINISNLPRPNFIAIDEGFGCADTDHLSSMSTLFAFLKTNFDFVWVISHLDQMRDMVDDKLEIKKENGFSKIVYI